MKKLFVLFLVVIFATGFLKAQNLVFDFEDGTTQGWENWSFVQTVVDNPFSGGINTSTKVMKLVQTGTWSGGIKQWIDPPRAWSNYKAIEFDVYLVGASGQLEVALDNSVSAGANFKKNPSVATKDAWVHVVVDISSFTTFDYKQIYMKNGASLECYVDNITYVSYPTEAPTSIALSASASSAIIGKTVQLTATVEPATADPRLNYASSDPAVATVDIVGKVTFIGAGTATIIATAKVNPGVSAVVRVTGLTPDPAYCQFYGFEGSGIEPFESYWAAPMTHEVMANSIVDANNPTANVLKIANLANWTGFFLKANDWNQVSKVSWWVLSPSTKTNFRFQVELDWGASFQKVVTIPSLAANTWTKVEIPIDKVVNPNDKRLIVRLTNGGSATYACLFDNFEIVAGNSFVPVTSFATNAALNASAIAEDNGSLQMEASDFLPAEATNKVVSWTIAGTNDPIVATVTAGGLVTAVRNGNAVVRAIADAGGAFVDKNITITGQIVPVDAITVTGSGAVALIDINKGTLQMEAAVLPIDANDKSVTWSTDMTGIATIDADGLLTAHRDGVVKVIASAKDGSNKSDTTEITISNQTKLTSIIITGEGDATAISTSSGTLQLIATVAPDEAADKSVIWSVDASTPYATVSLTGLVSAISDGVAKVIATAADGSGVTGELLITISNQVTATNVAITSSTGVFVIDTDNGTLQLSASVEPANASNKEVKWSVESGGEFASLSATGNLTAMINGTIKVKATSAADANVSDIVDVVVSNQVNLLTSVIVTAAGNATTITANDGTLQMSAAVLPEYANDKSVEWTVTNGTGEATINADGLLSAVKDGIVTVKATAKDGSSIVGELEITISGQIVKVSSITVSGAANATTISTNAGTLQMSAAVLPADASDKSVTWTVTNGTGEATISAGGLLAAVMNGTVIVKAVAKDGSAVENTLEVTISGQTVGISTTGSFDIVFYPNPVANQLCIDNASDISMVTISTINGQQIVQQKNTDSSIKLNVSAYKSGLYILKTTSVSGKINVFKFIKE